MKQARVFISGFVQGVGFRQFVKHSARKLGLTGWVKNLPASPSGGLGGPDQRVEAVFQGPQEKIEQMILLCRKGSLIAEVEDVVVEWGNTQEQFSDFEIQ